MGVVDQDTFLFGSTIRENISLGHPDRPLEKAPEDYLGSFRYLFPHADYFVVNVSSPNTPGLRSLQSGEQLDKILDILQTENQGRKPLLVKISPDLEWEDIIIIIDLAFSYQLAGIVATNTTSLSFTHDCN